MPLDTGGDGRLGRNDAVAGHRGVETFFELHKVEGVSPLSQDSPIRPGSVYFRPKTRHQRVRG